MTVPLSPAPKDLPDASECAVVVMVLSCSEPPCRMASASVGGREYRGQRGWEASELYRYTAGRPRSACRTAAWRGHAPLGGKDFSPQVRAAIVGPSVDTKFTTGRGQSCRHAFIPFRSPGSRLP